MGWPTLVTITVSLLIFAIGIGLGALIGHFSTKPTCNDLDECAARRGTELRSSAVENKTFVDHVLGRVSAANIRQNLRMFAGEPHIAGLQRDRELAELIRDRWLRDHLDSAEMIPYNVLLSYPNPDKPNKVSLLDGQGSALHVSVHIEDVLKSDKFDPISSQAYNAYAPNGTVTGELVYANYGTVEDFLSLKQFGVNVSGKICLVRDGQIFRGNKVTNAYEHGATGVVFFTDPSRVSPQGVNPGSAYPQGVDPSSVYPRTIMLPTTGMQWGSVFADIGDPLTPHWPSVDGAYRVPPSHALLPKIPSQPINYQDAERFLKIMGGTAAPAGWSGHMGLPISVGPGFDDANKKVRVRLEVNNQLKQVTIYNVIGKILGSVEPDRYAILGNHRDAWGYGASDPSSGTAQLLETARVFGQLAKEGWRPRRTLIFASWGAEEFGVIGSQEWVEENSNMLMTRAVGYVNTDVCVSGPNLEVSASPSVAQMVFRATKLVASPTAPSKSVYEKWQDTFPRGTLDEDMIVDVGSGTDVAPFAFYAGIPVADIWFRIDRQKYNMSMYPAYHTGYDTLYMMEKLVDPDYKIHRSCSQLALVMMLDLADSVLVPLEPRDLAKAMTKSIKFLDENLVTKQLETYGISLRYLQEAVQNFSTVVEQWQTRLSNTELTDALQVRSLNDQLLQMERSLILPGGLPDQPNSRHVLFSPSTTDAYASSAFSGVTDLLQELKRDDARQERTEDLKKHVTQIMVQIMQAAAALKPV